MPPNLAVPAQAAAPIRRRLLLLTLLVLLVHGLLLGGLSAAVSLWRGSPDAPLAPTQPLRFSTRTIAAPAAPPSATPAPAPARPAQRRPPAPRPAPPVVAPAVPDLAVAAAQAVAPTGTDANGATEAPPGVATDSSVPPDSTSGPVAPGDSGVPSATPQPSTVAETGPAKAKAPPEAPAQAALAAGSDAPGPPSLLPPAPVRMLFDGRGEERGFIKYAASAELLWLPVGGSYSARLEISAWGIRVRTWTSKGALGEAGLLPTRFGDKPRGAEQATHFQRDKGIISFSANNPDVPLQPGAQDKLSALLQLSALVAGAPERYGSGSRISFQAADAHRAEAWTFEVGALEPLELPGGALEGLKFSKAPTLEFDQRIEVWLAPAAQYLPVRLRITEANGAYADLLWRNTEKPD